MQMQPILPPPEDIAIAAEGATLRGRLFLPRGRPRASVVLHGASGVPAGFYRAFATWLAEERDLAVLTYDYRGFAASAQGHPRQSRASMADWGLRDQAAALDWMAARLPDSPRWVIGHSLGGLWMAHHPGMAGVERVITVGSGLAHVSDHPLRYRWRAEMLWRGPVPILARTLGYLPGRALGLGLDLPLQVYLDWRRWCLSHGWNARDFGTRLPMPEPARVRARMRLIAVADDDLVTQPAVWRLMARYPEAHKRQMVLRPADHGLKRIGHLDAFNRKNAVLWPAIID